MPRPFAFLRFSQTFLRSTAALLCTLGCSSSSSRSATPCQAGDQRPCDCGGTPGIQICDSGSFGSCQCGQDAGTGGTDAGSGGQSGAGGAGGAGGQDAGAAGQGGYGLADSKSCVGLGDCITGVSCCASRTVVGGTFKRDNNGAAKFSAKVADFELDVFEVTVGRFRAYAENEKALPGVGAGKHTHLGSGAIKDETGWLAGWVAQPPNWNSALTQCAKNSGNEKPTWTLAPGKNENRPLNCVGFEAAYAFCIWVGGFLPTEAELNYAFVNGSDAKAFPWGDEALDTTRAAYGLGAGMLPPDVGSKPAGAGKWGHHDLAGSVFEWTLDSSSSSYPIAPCDNCAGSSIEVYPRAIRGGGWESGAIDIAADRRYSWDGGGNNVGFRCAYPPPNL